MSEIVPVTDALFQKYVEKTHLEYQWQDGGPGVSWHLHAPTNVIIIKSVSLQQSHAYGAHFFGWEYDRVMFRNRDLEESFGLQALYDFDRHAHFTIMEELDLELLLPEHLTPCD